MSKLFEMYSPEDIRHHISMTIASSGSNMGAKYPETIKNMANYIRTLNLPDLESNMDFLDEMCKVTGDPITMNDLRIELGGDVRLLTPYDFVDSYDNDGSITPEKEKENFEKFTIEAEEWNKKIRAGQWL